MDSGLPWLTMARLPSLEIFSCVSLGSAIGCSLLATQTVVKTEMLLNHMPRYQLGEVVLPDLLVMAAAVGWKKPSANLPLLETSLSPTASTWPAARVSVVAPAAAAGAGACNEARRRRPSGMCRGFMGKQDRKWYE